MDDLDPSAQEIVTTADAAQTERAVEEIGPQNGVDVSLEGLVSPDDLLGAAPETPEQEEVQEEEKLEEVVDVSEEKAPEKELGSRASARVSEAVNRAKEAEAKMAEMQAQYQQQLAYMQYQMQQQVAAQQKAMEDQQAFYRKQAELAQARAEREDESKLTPAQKIEREWIRKAKEAANSEQDVRFKKLEEQLASERQLREQALQAAKERQLLQQYKQRADSVNKNVLFKEFDTDAVSKLSPKAQELLLTWGTASGEEPEKAVQGLHQFLEDYHRAKLKAISTKSGAKIKQSTTAPKPIAKTNGQAKAPKVKFDFASKTWVQTTT